MDNMSSGDRILLAATITDVLDGQYVYPACTACYSKLFKLSNAEQSICRKCNSIYNPEDVYYRYCLHLTAGDSSCLANITVFGAVLDAFFGITGSEFYTKYILKLESSYGSLCNYIMKLALEKVFKGQNLLFGFKTSKLFNPKMNNRHETFLKDICADSAKKNFAGDLPKLNAVQLLHHINACKAWTVVECLDNLLKNVEELGQDVQLTYQLIEALDKPKLPQMLSQVVRNSNKFCENSSLLVLDSNEQSLHLSCDSSLDPSDFNSSTILQTPHNNTLKVSLGAQHSTIRNAHHYNKECEMSVLHFSVSIENMHTGNEKNENIVESELTHFEDKLKNIDKSQYLFVNRKENSNSCECAKKESNNVKNHYVNRKCHPLNHSLCKSCAGLSWSVIKHSREEDKKVKQLKLGHGGQKRGSSHSLDEISQRQVTCVLTDSPEVVRHHSTGQHRSVSFDGDGFINHSEDTHINDSINPNSSNGCVYDDDFMPESEDLELFLAVANCQSPLRSLTQPLDQQEVMKSDTSSSSNSTIKEPTTRTYKPVACDNSCSELVSENQNFTISEAYAQSISFNVTLRKSQKKLKSFNKFQATRPDINNLTSDLPESEDLWQFLDNFSSVTLDENEVYHHLLDVSNINHNVNNKLSLSLLNTRQDGNKEHSLKLPCTKKFKDKQNSFSQSNTDLAIIKEHTSSLRSIDQLIIKEHSQYPESEDLWQFLDNFSSVTLDRNNINQAINKKLSPSLPNMGQHRNKEYPSNLPNPDELKDEKHSPNPSNSNQHGNEEHPLTLTSCDLLKEKEYISNLPGHQQSNSAVPFVFSGDIHPQTQHLLSDDNHSEDLFLSPARETKINNLNQTCEQESSQEVLTQLYASHSPEFIVNDTFINNPLEHPLILEEINESDTELFSPIIQINDTTLSPLSTICKASSNTDIDRIENVIKNTPEDLNPLPINHHFSHTSPELTSKHLTDGKPLLYTFMSPDLRRDSDPSEILTSHLNTMNNFHEATVVADKPTAMILNKKLGETFFKKVRFTTSVKEHYFHEQDVTPTMNMKPLTQKSLKSCLKTPKALRPCFNPFKHNVQCTEIVDHDTSLTSQELFDDDESYDSSIDLFSLSPVSLLSPSPVSHLLQINRKLPISSVTCELSYFNERCKDYIVADNETSIELFSPCSTPVQTNNICRSIQLLQNCITPDLFD